MLLVYLEHAGDLSSVTFVLALRRFIPCCGKPKEILNDNGINLVGSDLELHKTLLDLNQSNVRMLM